jgi:hypothetical protein
MSALLKPALRKRHIVGWRQAEREKVAFQRRNRLATLPKRPR